MSNRCNPWGNHESSNNILIFKCLVLVRRVFYLGGDNNIFYMVALLSHFSLLLFIMLIMPKFLIDIHYADKV